MNADHEHAGLSPAIIPLMIRTVQAYEPEATAALIANPGATLLVLLEVSRRTLETILPGIIAEAAPGVITAIMDVLNVHRWKTMGVRTLECECGAIVAGPGNLTEFPADEAFRRHIAQAVLSAIRL